MEALMIERSITTSAPRERVWKAVSNPRNLSRWLNMTIDFDKPVVGEVITFTFEGGSNQGSIAIVEPMERFGFRWKAHPNYEIWTLVSFLLKDSPEGTRITITEDGFDALPAEARQARIDLNEKGWGMVLADIVKDVETDIP
jgi:uncharacterized protein YndB with AHSA1/START domain